VSVGYGEEAVNIVSTDMVGPRVGAALRKKGVNSIVYALIGIMIYVGYRFNFRYSPGGVIALAHDVIITAGVFSLFHREINLVIVAALLTIAGYSINDTIVIFDRIREGRETTYRRLSLYDSVNRSLNETLSRTLLTVGTTLIVVVALLVLGGEILFDFALAMLIGFSIGTYSSLFIATPIYIWLEEWFVNRRKTKAKGAASR
jgi:preprotein translocase subunit SecF